MTKWFETCELIWQQCQRVLKQTHSKKSCKWQSFSVSVKMWIKCQPPCLTFNSNINRNCLITQSPMCLTQCLPTWFDLRNPYLVLKIFGGTPRWFNRYKDQGIITIGGTPDKSLRHPCVSQPPGWESLV